MAGKVPLVIGGIDTHGRSDHAAVIDAAGRVLGSAETLDTYSHAIPALQEEAALRIAELVFVAK